MEHERQDKYPKRHTRVTRGAGYMGIAFQMS